MRKVEQLYAIELLELDDGTVKEVKLWDNLAHQTQDIHFEHTESLISDNQEIATTTSRVKELHLRHSSQQLLAILMNNL